MKAWHEKQGPVHRVIIEMANGMGGFPFGYSASREDLLVGEAKRFLTELKKAIDAAELAQRPPLNPFWRTARST